MEACLTERSAEMASLCPLHTMANGERPFPNSSPDAFGWKLRKTSSTNEVVGITADMGVMESVVASHRSDINEAIVAHWAAFVQFARSWWISGKLA